MVNQGFERGKQGILGNFIHLPLADRSHATRGCIISRMARPLLAAVWVFRPTLNLYS